jgi:hypothetical protein
VKQHLLIGGDRTLNEALNQALKLEAAKAVAWPTARLREVTRVPHGRPPTPPERRRIGRPVCWKPGHFWRDYRQRPRDIRDQETRKSRRVEGPAVFSPLIPSTNGKCVGQVADGWIQERPFRFVHRHRGARDHR